MAEDPVLSQLQLNPQRIGQDDLVSYNGGVSKDPHLQLYMCDQLVTGNTPCQPAMNNFDSFLIKGEADKLYTVTKSDAEIQFVDGVSEGGKALHFSAYYGEFLNITDTSNLNSKQFSVSFWAKKDPSFANYGHAVSHINAKFTAGWMFDIGNTTSQSIRFAVVNGNGTLFTPPREVSMPDDGQDDHNANAPFTHIVGTFNGTAVKLYENGVVLGSIPFNGVYNADPNAPIKLAMTSYNFANPWAGTIDELRIYNRALSEEEVSDLYHISTENREGTSGTAAGGVASSPPINSEVDNGLMGYWPFDGSTNDESGNNNIEQYVIQTSGMVFTPDGRMLFNEKNTGKIRVMENDTVVEQPFAVVPNLHVNMEQGLLGITIDPDFEQNHYVYAYYTSDKNRDGSVTTSSDTEEVVTDNGTEIITDSDVTHTPFNRVIRYTDNNNHGENMTIIVDNIPANPFGMHAGGALAFGPDGKLYITVGNAYIPEAAQDKDSLLGKILRINKDGTIPVDNPFSGNPVYTLGHRNMYGIAFDNDRAGIGIVTENGDDYYDEINPIMAGGNYGYPTAQTPNKAPELSQNESTIKPLRSYWKTIAPTQAIFYQGSKFPELDGKFVVGSYNNGALYAFQVSGENSITGTANPFLDEEIKIQPTANIVSNVIGVAESPSGDIYYGGYYIYKLKSLDTKNQKVANAPIEVGYTLSQNDQSSLSSSDQYFNDIGITNVAFDSTNKMLRIDLEKKLSNGIPANRQENGGASLQENQTSQTTTESLLLTLRIDRRILEQITSVHVITNGGNTSQQQGQSIGFTVESNDQSSATTSQNRTNDNLERISASMITLSTEPITIDSTTNSLTIFIE